MNFRAIAIVVFLAVVSGGLMVHFRQQSLTGATSAPAESDGIPVPPKSGPYGKFVVVDDPLHDFGIMELGQEGSHEFKIRNDGPGPLKMVARQADHTCQCTLGSLGTDGLKPGEETTVTMKWTIKNPVTTFEHSAKIRTDDPENPVATFRVRGLVGQRLAISSGSDINIGMLQEKKLTERTIVLHSEIVDDFEITKLESSNPLIETTFRRMSGDELKEAAKDQMALSAEMMMEQTKKMADEEKRKAALAHQSGDPHGDHAPMVDDGFSRKKPEAKSGYEIKAVFQSGFPIGRFRESLLIHTNIPDTAPVVVTFSGSRAGPVQILGTPGISWTPDESMLRFPRFRAQEGKTAKLLVFVKKSEMPWEITDATVSPKFLKYQFIKDENFKGAGRDRYDLLVEIPPSETPLIISGDTVGQVILNTNHPEAKVIKLGVEFTSY